MLYVDMNFYHFGKNEIKSWINVQFCHMYYKLDKIETFSLVAFLTGHSSPYHMGKWVHYGRVGGVTRCGVANLVGATLCPCFELSGV